MRTMDVSLGNKYLSKIVSSKIDILTGLVIIVSYLKSNKMDVNYTLPREDRGCARYDVRNCSNRRFGLTVKWSNWRIESARLALLQQEDKSEG